eukprot:7353377-Karenia_brevis.AAC.1
MENLCKMVYSLTEVLYFHNLQWKSDSLEFMSTSPESHDSFWLPAYLPQEFQDQQSKIKVPFTDHMDIL